MQRRLRTIYRTIHLVVAGLLGTFVYAPDGVREVLWPVLAFGGIPLAGLTGLFLFKPKLAPWAPRRRPHGA